MKKGFEFTLMVVGESGLGKSTLVNSLFLTDLYPERVIPDAIGKLNFVYIFSFIYLHIMCISAEYLQQRKLIKLLNSMLQLWRLKKEVSSLD